jgi:hypothetical protein
MEHNENHENYGYIKIKSYESVWKTDKHIYAILNIVLWRPVSIMEFLTFSGALAFVLFLEAIFPPFAAIPALLRVLALPLGLTWLMLQFRPEGMHPLKFVALWLAHMFTRDEFVERFKRYNPRSERKIKMKWWYSHVKTKSTLKRR